MIQHSVIFNLKHTPGSTQEQAFFDAARQLATIPGVEQFVCLRQVSPKNPFSFGLSMVFVNQAVYDQYNQHPLHQAFIEQHWLTEVIDFMEIDYLPL
ncbi:Dabb family protein [Spirosoma sp. KNUC1025]|uniref:Dabb family protein n=1 Tax=Spirosoma sp. KNUC1025 TaxID=2894082 RepID=UPI00386ED3D2|nr:Dabb family protein [Spirosoma sp. KNUC1025]